MFRSFDPDDLGNRLSLTRGYDAENQLNHATATGKDVVPSYDPLGRLWKLAGGGIGDVSFAYDGGDQLTAEFGVRSGALIRRTVFADGIDEPLVAYDASGTRTWLAADERGSIIARIDSAGTLTGANTYGEYGIEGPFNAGRFGYTGQMRLPEIGLDYYKARMYWPGGGRFVQPDPLGYAGGVNPYVYVLNDPVNLVDPLGLGSTPAPGNDGVVVIACQNGGQLPNCNSPGIGLGGSIAGSVGIGGGAGEPGSGRGQDITVIGQRPAKPTHTYVDLWRITRQNTQCTFAQVQEAVKDNFVPWRTGGNVSGQQYNVAPLHDVAPAFSFTSPDTITFRQTSPTTYVNVTESDHYLRYGSVSGTIIGNQLSGFSVRIIGSGNNVSSFRAWLNRKVGKVIFQGQARAMNQQLLSECGG